VPCYSPLTGYRSRVTGASGKRQIVFKSSEGYLDQPVEVPCGRCIGCRLEYSRQWAVRCVHEASLYDENSFLTLTYSPENLPSNGSLVKRDLQLFFKRLRKSLPEKKIRYFACGEYGDRNGRPHYHVCLFNHNFRDRYLYTVRDGVALYRSESLERLWPAGFSTIGDVTFESAAYVARYTMKKFKGDEDEKKKHYEICDSETGEIHDLLPEFAIMSRRPGIGSGWGS